MRFLSFILSVTIAFTAFGFNRTDSVNVRFRVGHSNYEPSLGNNREVMDDFIRKVRDAVTRGEFEGITVSGYASPDGPGPINQRLAKNRCATIAEYIAAHAGVNPDLIERCDGGIGWDELRRLVTITPGVPYKERIIDILENTPVYIFDAQGKIISGRKKKLMDLAGGRPYKWMLQHLFPEVRNAVAIALTVSAPADVEQSVETIETELKSDAALTDNGVEIIESTDSTEYSESLSSDSISPDETGIIKSGTDFSETGIVDSLAGTLDDSAKYERDFYSSLFALKTNLLYYGILLPNAELEWYINRHWSVAVSSDVAWWGSYKKNKSYRLVVFDAEGRYWFRLNSPRHGVYAGILGGAGYYDFLRHDNGKYGYGIMAGVTGGYMWMIGRHLSLEAELGAGYLFTRYKEYKPIEGHHVYQRTKDLHFFGPLKLKFAIGWHFGNRKAQPLKISSL